MNVHAAVEVAYAKGNVNVLIRNHQMVEQSVLEKTKNTRPVIHSSVAQVSNINMHVLNILIIW